MIVVFIVSFLATLLWLQLRAARASIRRAAEMLDRPPGTYPFSAETGHVRFRGHSTVPVEVSVVELYVGGERIVDIQRHEGGHSQHAHLRLVKDE